MAAHPLIRFLQGAGCAVALASAQPPAAPADQAVLAGLYTFTGVNYASQITRPRHQCFRSRPSRINTVLSLSRGKEATTSDSPHRNVTGTRAYPYNSGMRWLPLVLVLTAPLLPGQVLEISSKSAQAGNVTVEVALHAPSGKAPVALQWEIDFPAQQLTAEGKGPLAGKAATDSGKSLTCVDHWKKAPQIYSYTCILAGGQTPIANGPVAVIAFKRVGNKSQKKADVSLENIQSVTADLKKVPLKHVTAVIAAARRH